MRRQAAAAICAGRPVVVLAIQLYALDTVCPRGRSATTERLATLMASSADFRSGRRCRPGRQVAAELLGVSERTIERQWRILEGCDAGVVLVAEGRWLKADERSEAYADPAERDRWRDRAEWRLDLPEWARELSEADLEPYVARARALLLELAAGAPVENPAGGHLVAGRRVAPSVGGLSTRYVALRRDQFLRSSPSRPVTPVDGKRPDGRSRGGAASRPSSRKRSAQPERRMPAQACRLAAELLAGGFVWLRGQPLYLVASAVRRLPRWTAADVAAHVESRLRAEDQTLPGGLSAPVAFLRWALADADPDAPPVQMARARQAAAGETARAHTARGRAEAAERAAATLAGYASPVGQAARAQARTAILGGRERQRAADRREAAARAAAVEAVRRPAPSVLEFAGDVDQADECVSCHGVEQVAVRYTPTPVVLCPACWESIRRVHGA